jgi:C-terminal peptidase prc
MHEILLVLASLAVPAPVSGGGGPPREEARSFALEVCSLLDQVTDHFVKPVPREKVFEAALTGLYLAARRPVPASLAVEVRRRYSAPPASGPLPPGKTPTEPREDLIARAYQTLGLPRRDALMAVCRGLSAVLDPHSGLVTAEEQRKTVGLDNESVGLGIELDGERVEMVYPGSPAQAAGVRPGDLLTSVNGKPLKSLPEDLRAAIRNDRMRVGPARLGCEDKAPDVPGARLLRLSWKREGQERELTADVTRMRYRSETVQGARRGEGNRWDHFMGDERKTALVRITSLSRGTSEEVRAVVEMAEARGAQVIVLDLRWCPGGYLNEAVDVAALFLGDEIVATVKGRGREDSVYRGTGAPLARTVPLLALVNQETSGGAELIAAALQDHGRATVVGQRTLGKASVQTPLATGVEGVGFKLTTGTFVRPSGKNLHRFRESQPRDDWGVHPDVDCRVSPDLGARLKRDWQAWSLRPEWSRERLALDDPRADPQLLEAVRQAARLAESRSRLSSRK